MTFEVAGALVLLFAVIAVAMLFRLAFLWKERMLALLAASSSPGLLANASTRKHEAVHAALVLAALAALAFAIARPHWGQQAPPAPPSVGDLMIVMDVSQSMAARDVQPSRLGAAKAQVSGLLERLQGERVGLVVFAGSATVRFPLTRDYGAAASLTRAVEVDSAPTPGSSYGDGVRSAVRALTQTETPLRAVFLVGDGENLSDGLAAAAGEAAEHGIPIYAVGIGTDDGGTIPVTPQGGGTPSEKRDAGGQVVVTRLMEDGLRAVTDRTGGGYRRASGGGRELQQLYETLAQRYASTDTERSPLDATDLTPYFILVAFVALLMEWLAPERRGGARGRHGPLSNSPPQGGRGLGMAPPQGGRGLGMAPPQGGRGLGIAPPQGGRGLGVASPERGRGASLASLVAPLALLAITGCSSASLEAFELNEEGGRLYAEGRYHDALERFRKAQVQQPELVELDFNAGTGLYQTDELERAVRETQQALNTENGELRAWAHYNMGNAYFRMNRFLDAYEAYKKALRERPEDLDAKVNLELALHRLRQQQSQQQPGSGDSNQQQQPGNQQQPGTGDPSQGGGNQSPGQQGQPGNPDEQLRRELRQAGQDITIEEALRVLDVLREREAQFQRRYNQAPPERRQPGRVEKDW